MLSFLNEKTPPASLFWTFYANEQALFFDHSCGFLTNLFTCEMFLSPLFMNLRFANAIP